MLSGHGSNYPEKWSEAIDALLRRATVEDAATEVGISSRTLRRWMLEPEFIEEYTKRRLEASRHAMSRMQSESSQAVATIFAIVNDSNASGAVRLNAAKIVLEWAKEASKIDERNLRFPPIEHMLGGTVRDVMRRNMERRELDREALNKKHAAKAAPSVETKPEGGPPTELGDLPNPPSA